MGVMNLITLHVEAIIMTSMKYRRNHFLPFARIKMMRHAYNVFLTPVSFNQGKLGMGLQIFKGLCIVMKIGDIIFPLFLI